MQWIIHGSMTCLKERPYSKVQYFLSTDAKTMHVHLLAASCLPIVTKALKTNLFSWLLWYGNCYLLNSMRKVLSMLKMAVPSTCTFGNLGCGFGAAIAVVNGRFDIAPWFIIVAMIFDAYDGKLARYLNATSKLGCELDSFCDLTTFGIAPALLVGGILSKDYPILGWVLGFFFVAAAVYRLARFNVMQAEGEDHHDYTGLATTGAGGMVAALVILNGYIFNNFDAGKIIDFLPFITIILSLLMISRIRFPNSMDFADRKFKSPLYASILSGTVVLFAWLPQVVPTILFSGYIAAGFLGIIKEKIHLGATHKL